MSSTSKTSKQSEYRNIRYVLDSNTGDYIITRQELDDYGTIIAKVEVARYDDIVLATRVCVDLVKALARIGAINE